MMGGRNLYRAVGWWRQCVWLAVVLGCLTLIVHGQEATGKNASEEAIQDDGLIRIRTDEVMLPVSVRDDRGRTVEGLGPESFLIYDNGIRQQITSFNQRRAPANIVLLMDASASVFGDMRLIREAATRFLSNLLKQDQVCVMQFADAVEVLQDWTPATETKELKKALAWRYRPGSRTTFYDGLYLAAEKQLKKVEGRRIIILLTDGIDTAAGKRTSFSDALVAVGRIEASVYVVSLTASLRADLESRVGGRFIQLFGGYDPRLVAQYFKTLDEAEKLLERLAVETGGRIFFPRRDEELLPAYASIADELRTQYLITYRPTPRAKGGDWRRIEVLVAPGGYQVATRAGYTGRA